MELWNGATTVSLQQPIYLTSSAHFCYLIMTSILTVALKAFEKKKKHMGQGDKK